MMDDSDDPFFLDWGSSVNVNEDLRRSIQSEINALDQEIRDLDQSITTEEKISSHLRKDYAHAHAELMNLRRGASEEKENASMNEQIQMRLGDSLQNEVVEVLSTTSFFSLHRRTDQHPHQQPLEDDATSNETRISGLSMKDYIEKRIRDVDDIKTKIYAKKASLDEHGSAIAELQFQLKQTKERIAQEQKHQSLWNDDVEATRKEHDAERQRIKNIKESLSKSRKNIGDWTQQDADCMKSFNDLRSTNSKEEATWKASLAANEAIVSELTHKVEDLTASIAKTTQHVDLLNDQFIQRESMVKERERIRKEMKQVNLQIEAHIIKELELKKLITEARQISDNQAIEMNKIKKRKSDVDLLRARNDEEDDALKPVRQELPRLVAISDDVSREISNLQETIAANEQTYQSELLTMERSLEETIKQVRERKKEVEERREILEKTEAALRELNKATLEEIEQHRNLKSNFDAAYETQAKLVARKEMEIAKIRSERIEAKKLERLSEEISLEKLQCGVRIIQETERIEKEYMEKIKELEVV